MNTSIRERSPLSESALTTGELRRLPVGTRIIVYRGEEGGTIYETTVRGILEPPPEEPEAPIRVELSNVFRSALEPHLLHELGIEPLPEGLEPGDLYTGPGGYHRLNWTELESGGAA